MAIFLIYWVKYIFNFTCLLAFSFNEATKTFKTTYWLTSVIHISFE